MLVYVVHASLEQVPGAGDEPVLEVYSDREEAEKAKDEIAADHPDVLVTIHERSVHGGEQ